MDDKRAMLLHFLAALAYRTQKAVRGAPSSFAEFEAGNQVRTPSRLLSHMDSVLGYAMTCFQGEPERYQGTHLATLDQEIDRFHGKLEALARHLRAGTALRRTTPEQLLQGPLADAMTHAGQIAMLRRLAGAPVPPENFIVAAISPGNLGPDQPEPVSPDRDWPERPKQEYTIAAARPQDLPELGAIELRAATLLEGQVPRSILAESTSDEDFEAAQKDGRLWVALHGDQPVGFAIVEMLDDGLPHLEEIDVDPQHGRRGLGSRLVRAVCDWTAERGYAEITLTTFRAVPWNMPFYAGMGFEVVPEAHQRPALRDVVRYESARGLDAAARCVMRYRVPAMR